MNKKYVDKLAESKVDKVDGKGLSTNDFTDEEKQKLADLSESAYTLPVASSDALGGVKSGTDITVDASGNVSVNDNSHNHSASNINSGTLSSDRLSTVPIAKGGTGATTASGVLTNLGITATATELNYVDGVTSNIQIQLDAKATTKYFTATIPTTGWSSAAPYVLTINVGGILTTDTPQIAVVQSSDMETAKEQLEAWNCINNIITSEDSLICTCYDKIPTVEIPIIIKVVRSVGEDDVLLANYYTKEQTYNKEEVLALIPKIVRLTQTEYDTLVSEGTIDENTLYYIVEESGE